MASFLDIDTDGVQEPRPASEGEHKIRLTGYLTKKDEVTGEEEIFRVDKNGFKYFMPQFDIPADVVAPAFSKYYAVPDKSSMDDKKYQSSMLAFKRFKKAMGIEGGFDLDEIVGREVWAILGVESDEEYGDKNYIKRFI